MADTDYVACTPRGKAYHRISHCSATHVIRREDAIRMRKYACKKCRPSNNEVNSNRRPTPSATPDTLLESVQRETENAVQMPSGKEITSLLKKGLMDTFRLVDRPNREEEHLNQGATGLSSQYADHFESEKIFDSQKAVGDELLKKIQSYVDELNSSSTGVIEKIMYFVLVPSSKSLREQTIRRIVASGLDRECVKMASTSPSFRNAMLEKISHNYDARCLFVFFQDECHWGAEKGSMMSETLRQAEFASNDNGCSVNMIIVHISATAYSFFPSFKSLGRDHVENNVVDWEDIPGSLSGGGSTSYYGSKFYTDQARQSNTSQLERKNEIFKFQNVVDEVKRNAQLTEIPNAEKLNLKFCIEYICAIFHHWKLEFPTCLQRDLSGSSAEERARVALRVLKTCFPDNTSVNKKIMLVRCSSVGRATMLFDLVHAIRDKENSFSSLKQLNVLLDVGDNKSSLNLQNVQMPLLLIVVKKFGMGDTIPPHAFGSMDVRTRYDNNNFALSTFIQDIGRTFGWKRKEDMPYLAPGRGGYDRLMMERHAK